jgi:hypothetical protein
MSDGPTISDGPDRGDEPPEDPRVAEWLQAATPVPAAGFRGALGRYLQRLDPGYGPRPEQLRLITAASMAGGAALLFVAALQATGVI